MTEKAVIHWDDTMPCCNLKFFINRENISQKFIWHSVFPLENLRFKVLLAPTVQPTPLQGPDTLHLNVNAQKRDWEGGWVVRARGEMGFSQCIMRLTNLIKVFRKQHCFWLGKTPRCKMFLLPSKYSHGALAFVLWKFSGLSRLDFYTNVLHMNLFTDTNFGCWFPHRRKPSLSSNVSKNVFLRPARVNHCAHYDSADGAVCISTLPVMCSQQRSVGNDIQLLLAFVLLCAVGISSFPVMASGPRMPGLDRKGYSGQRRLLQRFTHSSSALWNQVLLVTLNVIVFFVALACKS